MRHLTWVIVTVGALASASALVGVARPVQAVGIDVATVGSAATARSGGTRSALENGRVYCGLEGTQIINPTYVPLHETAHITLTTVATCAVREMMIVWPADPAGGQYRGGANDPQYVMRDALETWLETVDLRHLQVGVVAHPVKVVQPLTTNRNDLLLALWWKWANLAVGSWRPPINTARLELLRARATSFSDQSMVILGVYPSLGDGPLAMLATDAAKADGIEVFVVAQPGHAADDMASDPEHYFRWYAGIGNGSIEVIDAFLRRTMRSLITALDDSTAAHAFETIAITTTVPATFAYEPGSANPPAAWDPARRELTWTFPTPPITTTGGYDVRPLVCGSATIPGDSFAWGRDVEGNEYRHDYVPVAVDVPCATSTPTATVPSPTPSTTPSPTATTRPTTAPQALYLPLALRELPCRVSRSAAVALVIDTSSSMLELAGNGRTKLATATDAAARFLDILGFPNDQAAIVAFDSTARVAQELTGDKAALRAALAGLRSGTGTRIDLGVAMAAAELTSARRHAGNLPAMVVLTDGQATGGPQAAIVEADRAKQAGILMFTIGLGDTVDQNQLRSMASRPEWFYVAATADDLAAVYSVVAADLPCPGDRYWGRRP